MDVILLYQCVIIALHHFMTAKLKTSGVSRISQRGKPVGGGSSLSPISLPCCRIVAQQVCKIRKKVKPKGTIAPYPPPSRICHCLNIAPMSIFIYQDIEINCPA